MSAVSTQSSISEARSKNPYFWIALLIGAVMLGLYLSGGAMISKYGTVTRAFGWVATRSDGNWYVGEVEPRGPAAGVLQAGDLILAANDDHRITSIDALLLWSVIGRRETYTIEIKRGLEQRRIELRMETRHSYRTLGAILSNIAASLGFYLVGLMLGLIKPEDRLTRRASLTLLGFASFTAVIALSQMESFLTPWERITLVAISPIYPIQFALGYHFYYRFPSSAPRGRFWTTLQYLLYFFAVLVWFPKMWLNL